VVIDCRPQILKVALGAAARPFVGLAFAGPKISVFSAKPAVYVGERLCPKKIKQSLRSFGGFARSRLPRNDIGQVDVNHVRDDYFIKPALFPLWSIFRRDIFGELSFSRRAVALAASSADLFASVSDDPSRGLADGAGFIALGWPEP
jgi:hypothetical protein